MSPTDSRQAPLHPGRCRATAGVVTSSTRSRASAPSGYGGCSPRTPRVSALGAMTGGQAVQMVKAGLKAIYLSGWQVAADANLSGNTYPDQSLYPASSAPALVKRINSALLRADQITHAEGDDSVHWLAPIVADAEAGFGGPLNAYEIMKSFIEAGAAAVHFEDQLLVGEEVRPPRAARCSCRRPSTSAPSSQRGSRRTSPIPRPNLKPICGGSGIRTHGGLPHTRFPSVPIRPLSHPS